MKAGRTLIGMSQTEIGKHACVPRFTSPGMALPVKAMTGMWRVFSVKSVGVGSRAKLADVRSTSHSGPISAMQLTAANDPFRTLAAHGHWPDRAFPTQPILT